MVLYVVDAFIFGTGHTRLDEFGSGRIFVKIEECYAALESSLDVEGKRTLDFTILSFIA